MLLIFALSVHTPIIPYLPLRLWQRQRIRIRTSTPPESLLLLDNVLPRIHAYEVPRPLHQQVESVPPQPPAVSSSTLHLLPVRALNEVFISTCMSAR